MAVKTITIDIAAYELLARRKRPGQSFSDVIKAEVGGRRSAADLLAVLDRLAVDESTLAAVEDQVQRRRRQRSRAARL
jgi:predicted CopG family antitoxin